MVVIIVCIIVVVVGYEVLGIGNRDNVVVNQLKVEEAERKEDNIEVYIIGCVKNPGTYEVPRNITVGKLADRAGGFTEGADLERVNLVYRIKDNMMIVIKDKKEREEQVRKVKTGQKSDICEKEKCNCSKYTDKTRKAKDDVKACDNVVDESIKKESTRNKNTSSVEKSSKKKKASKKNDVSASGPKENISVAGSEENKVKSIVPGEEIVDSNENISSGIENLAEKTPSEKIPSCNSIVESNDKVESGKKRKKTCSNKQESGMEIIKGLYVDDKEEESQQVNINTATKEELMSLKGVGESMAEKIIKYREDNGDFKEIDELKLVAGMGDSKFNKIKDCIVV